MMVNYQGVRRRKAALVQKAVRPTNSTPVFAYISLCFREQFFDYFLVFGCCCSWFLLISLYIYICMYERQLSEYLI